MDMEGYANAYRENCSGSSYKLTLDTTRLANDNTSYHIVANHCRLCGCNTYGLPSLD